MEASWEDEDGLTPFDQDEKFRAWLRELDEDVIQAEYGYEPGEFTVFGEHWHPMYLDGITPAAAFKRALDAFAEERRERDRQRKENWARIQVADAAAINRT